MGNVDVPFIAGGTEGLEACNDFTAPTWHRSAAASSESGNCLMESPRPPATPAPPNKADQFSDHIVVYIFKLLCLGNEHGPG